MSGLNNIPEGTNIVKNRIQINKLLSEARANVKPTKCILCGKEINSCCNSHSVPQLSLKSIALNGKILLANTLIGIEPVNFEGGIRNSGTFYLICNCCDNTFFKEYEDAQCLLKKPTDKMLAEIAVKNILLQLSKRYIEKELYKLCQERLQMFENPEDMQDLNQIDIDEYRTELFLHKDIVESNKNGCYQLLFWKILPYKIPIAMQSAVVLRKDMEGSEINDIFNMSKEVRMQYLHLAILPMDGESMVLAFYHKRDKLYKKLWHQFNSSSLDKCLGFINYIIFAYTENYFISPRIKDEIKNNIKLIQLSQEVDEIPQMGLLNIQNDYGKGYKAISPDEIPNFLSEEWKII